jgi:hypothetical protein
LQKNGDADILWRVHSVKPALCSLWTSQWSIIVFNPEQKSNFYKHTFFHFKIFWFFPRNKFMCIIFFSDYTTVKGKGKFALVYAMKVFTGSMFIAPIILNLGSGMDRVVHIRTRKVNLVAIIRRLDISNKRKPPSSAKIRKPDGPVPCQIPILTILPRFALKNCYISK